MEKPKGAELRDRIIKAISSLCYLGHVSKFPGTLASLLGLLAVVITGTRSIFYFFVLSTSIIIGFVITGEAERIYGKKDPKEIVIDEFCGMILSLFLVTSTAFNLIIGFVFFRLFDILKPYPIKESQKIRGAAGIMLDDILSGIYANLVLHILRICMHR